MDWTEILRKTIDYIEDNLLEKITADNIAASVNVSPFYLQKGFSLVTGYTIAEYIRYRRLYLSALDIIDGNEKIIDIAFRYGYDSSESFSKAFSRFHGIPPVKLKQKRSGIRLFTSENQTDYSRRIRHGLFNRKNSGIQSYRF